MKKLLVSGLLALSLLSLSVTAFAMDSRITASGHNEVVTSNRKGIYASGYTTSKTKHYTSVRLYANDQGQIRTSDRIWGKGKISATSEGVSYSSKYSYGSAVYYGFD